MQTPKKIVQVGKAKYWIYSKEDEISLVHELAKMGYEIPKIAKILGVSERTVKKYMTECW